MDKLRNIIMLAALCLFLAVGQIAIGASLDTVKKDMNMVAGNFITIAEISADVPGYLQYTDTIREENTTWYLIMLFIGNHPAMVYIQEEITVNDGKVLYFDGIAFNINTYKWLEDHYAYHIDRNNNMTYMKKDYTRSWERGIEKFKNKYRL